MDFYLIATKRSKDMTIEVYPKFIVNRTNDLMIRGGDFYAVWNEQEQLWSTDENVLLNLIDNDVKQYANKLQEEKPDVTVIPKFLWDSESGLIDKWHKYCQKHLRDNYVQLDDRITFADQHPKKEDYVSKKLSYTLNDGPTDAWDELVGTLYSSTEKEKIEWAIGSIVAGDSVNIQKFLVFYGSAGTGKSTVLNIIQKLFEGYYSVFDAKALGSSNNSFALEPFKCNPLVGIQHDGDLSRIEDNTRLNSLVSHEMMTVNEKYKSLYSNRYRCFLFMGTNKPVKITDSRSGIIRRLIDVSPTGKKVSQQKYNTLTKKIDFELGAIANKCKNVYLSNPTKYDKYVPVIMLNASNDFYNFVLDSYNKFMENNGVPLKVAWEMYKNYCDEAKVQYPFSMRIFREELRNYFEEYHERYILEDGTRARSYYHGFKDLINLSEESQCESDNRADNGWLSMKSQPSVLDDILKDQPAQYANNDGLPYKKWDSVKTTLSSIDTSILHYVKVPLNHIVIDFDLKDNGEKSLAKNIEAASKFPKTYAELSKSGKGVHLHYIYEGDVSKLAGIYSENIEVKVFNGNSSLRRLLTKCNNEQIAVINSGLPIKKENKVIDFNGLKNEKAIRTVISRHLKKEIMPSTKSSIDMIYKTLEEAYNSGINYDVSDLKNVIYAFAMNSTNQAAYCVKKVADMKFFSEHETVKDLNEDNTDDIVFFDVEVFPNLFLINWKFRGAVNPVIRLINPTPNDVDNLCKHNLIGFNCKRYDNHMLYARLIGYSNEELYNLSQKIINEGTGFFGQAYNLSYTDVYDFASAGNKMSLKKFEIKLGIHHKELGLPWDEPVKDEDIPKVAEYCDNDVIATEAVFDFLKGDWFARQILADLSRLSLNTSTNEHTARIIFGAEKNPQKEFRYRDLSKPVFELDEDVLIFLKKYFPDMMAVRHGEANSLLPYFDGYKFDNGVSTYKGIEVGEGGLVYSEPGVYFNVALLDITSQHPHSTLSECYFGPKYTQNYMDLVETRVEVKHQNVNVLRTMLDGKLSKYVGRIESGELSSKYLSNGLKTPINAVYGQTFASFDNRFRDIRNIDNIIAKRGALFMVDLKEFVESKGFTVAHIKTDSIKIPDATPEIIEQVKEFGKKYGYNFEHEATYEKMCLVNKAVYIAKDAKDGHWTATGTQFAVPYVFKTLFSHEPIVFSDLCETKTVSTEMLLDMNETLPDGEHNYQYVGKVGAFCPIKSGHGGGVLVSRRKNKDGSSKYDSVTGTKDYMWLESEDVKNLGKEDDIDISYYESLVDDAVKTISKYVNFNKFVEENDGEDS